MTAPLIRRFTRAAPSALNSFANATDDETGLEFIRLATKNRIQDLLNDPDPSSGVRFKIELKRGGVGTGRNFFSSSLSPDSAGRVAVGPIDLKAGNLFFSVAQTIGALEAYSFIVKLADQPE